MLLRREEENGEGIYLELLHLPGDIMQKEEEGNDILITIFLFYVILASFAFGTSEIISILFSSISCKEIIDGLE